MSEERELILAIESSCDETSVAIIEGGDTILSNVVASQIKSHRRFGGVVPEVASRHHVEQITICIEDALNIAQVDYSDLSAVAVTYGPGLVGALLIGVCAAKALAFAHDLPLIAVNHMAGHIYAAQLVQPITYPAMALLVSGGHTELVYLKAPGSFEIIGETRDDAAGEAYDKVGRVLNLTYPAGKAIDELAHQGEDTYHFPRAMSQEDNFDFSFSGLKSAFINKVHNADQKGETLDRANLAASFQASVVDVLVAKTIRACETFPTTQLIMAGGVAANSQLRATLSGKLSQELPNVTLNIPPLSLCGDNGAMIGAAAHILWQKGIFSDASLNANPSLEFDWMKGMEA